jgi:predicted metal-dependent hydrolase
MLKENHDLKSALEEYLQLLDKHSYFDAHEVLEEAWHPLRKAKNPLANLVKGLINASICFEHIKRNRNESRRKALQVLKSFERHKYLCTEEIKHYKLFHEACKKIEDLKKVHKM